MRVQARHKPNCVPGSELACVGLASQLGTAAGVSASVLQASSQSCQQVGGQVPMLPPTPPACRHKATSKDLQMQDRGQLGTALAEAKSKDSVTKVRRSKALLYALLVKPGNFRDTGAEACTASHCRNAAQSMLA